MKLLLILQLTLYSILSFGQGNDVSIVNRSTGLDIKLLFEQQPYSKRLLDNKYIVEYINAMDEAQPGVPILPSKTYFIAIPPLSKISINIIEQKYNFIKNVEVALNPEVHLSDDSILVYRDSNPDLSKFIYDQFPSVEVEVIDYTWIRDFFCAVVKVNTHTYGWKKKEIRELSSTSLKIDFIETVSFKLNQSPIGEFDKILSKIILNYGDAAQFRASKSDYFPADSTGNWIDYSREYVKLQIPDDGIYRIDYNQVVEYGINPASVNPKTFKIFSKGTEVPIFVSGESDLSFDQGDFIEFWSEKNHGSPDYTEIVLLGEDYLNYFDRYSDTSIVWLSWDGNDGKRITVQSTSIPGLSDTLFNHKVFMHLEDDERLWYYDAVSPRVQLPNWQENKVWTWLFLGNGGSIPFNFTVSSIVPGTSVNVTARMISNATDQLFTNNHRFGLSLNSPAPEDTIVFSYKETVNFDATYDSNQLVSGNNTVNIFGMQNDSLRFHQALIDWVDIEYQRYNSAVNDSLLIIVPDNFISQERVIKVTNISRPQESMLVYKVKPPYKKITSFEVSNSILTFTDTVSANDEYIVVEESLNLQPTFLTKKYFLNLRNNSRGADYIAISNRLLQTSAEDYVNFMNNNYATRNELIYIDDICDEFAYGYIKPEAIKDFLQFASVNWIAPSPSYLLLLGDANYDYKFKLTPPPTVKRKNLVPSYGNPVSDVWFTMWDSSNVNLPQMFVGRVPATSNEEVYFYLDKHQTYLNRSYDDFNKRYLFFSGGDPSNPGQLDLLKSTNNFVLNNFVKPIPVGGEAVHFYKTINPPTNFGPYTREQIDNAIDSSGLFISYIGHSGTETWDNGITEVTDLQPAFNDRFSLISDFGCSTGKFAEPDVDAFSELFISASPDGQAISYLGNSSWGYVSTSVNFPQLFYEKLLLDSAQVISQAHYSAKIKLLNQYGTSDVNRVFNFSNILFGDPLIQFKLPPKPNFSVKNSSFTLLDEFPLDLGDSVNIKVEVINFGKAATDSVTINITDNYLGNQSYTSEFKIEVPLYKRELYLNIPISGMVGEHILTVELDRDNLFDEIYEDDNIANFSFVVYSSSIRLIKPEKFYNPHRDHFEFLNPVFQADTSVNSIVVAFSDNPDFNNSFEKIEPMGIVKSLCLTPVLTAGKRFWFRARLNLPQSSWSEPYSFFDFYTYGWNFLSSFNYSDIQYENVAFDSADNSWKLPSFENILELGSAGGDDGEFGSLKLNGSEKLPNTYYWGIATAIIDSVSLEPSAFNYYLYWDSYADTLLLNYIDSLPNGTLLAMTICSDGAQSILGYSPGTPIRQMIETLGSLYVDSILYRDSWCIIGKKGAPQGTVPESFSRRYSGPADLDTSLIVSNKNGWIEFPVIKNSKKWLSVTKTDSIPPGSFIEYIPLGIKQDNTVDTLNALQFSNNTADISGIDANIYPSIKLLSNFQTNESSESPVFQKMGVDFLPVPDLAINYQVVSTTSDSVLIGEDIGLTFKITNVVSTKADSFNVKVEILNADNSRQLIFSEQVDSLHYNVYKNYNIVHNTSSGSGSKSFLITIDSNSEVRELFEDNNFFSIPFYVQPDTTTPTVTLTIDGYDIIDGDYIAANPLIQIELNDQSLLPITDPSSVLIFLNEELIPSDTSIISYTFSQTNPKVVVDFNPTLSDGEYDLKVLWKDAEGNIVDSSGVNKYFQVSSEAQLLYVYNYPNPTSGETYFTFKLTQIPENISIKIFTIAGRLIKEIDIPSSELKFDFNKIYWDGKDEDGDPIANGVYIYKVIMQAGETTQDITQKLAVVK